MNLFVRGCVETHGSLHSDPDHEGCRRRGRSRSAGRPATEPRGLTGIADPTGLPIREPDHPLPIS